MANFEYPTNFSNGTAVIDPGTFTQFMHYATDGWFAYGFLFVIFMVLSGIFLVAGIKRSLAASSFITFIFSIYFWRLDMVNPILCFAFILLAIVAALGAKEEGQI